MTTVPIKSSSDTSFAVCSKARSSSRSTFTLAAERKLPISGTLLLGSSVSIDAPSLLSPYKAIAISGIVAEQQATTSPLPTPRAAKEAAQPSTVPRNSP